MKELNGEKLSDSLTELLSLDLQGMKQKGRFNDSTNYKETRQSLIEELFESRITDWNSEELEQLFKNEVLHIHIEEYIAEAADNLKEKTFSDETFLNEMEKKILPKYYEFSNGNVDEEVVA